MSKEDEQIKAALAQSVEKINGAAVPTPDFMFFRKMVDREQENIRRAQRRQFALFAVVAACILSAVVFLAGISEVFFITLQAVALAGTVVGLVVFFARRPKEGLQR